MKDTSIDIPDSVEPRRIHQLLRLGAERALTLISQDEVMEKMEQAGMAGTGRTSSQDDPVLIAATRRAIRSSLIHWLNSTIEKPETKVAPFVTDNILQSAINMQDLGIPELMYSLDRSGQNVAWEYWMQVAFEICETPQELKSLLDVSFKSISTYVDESRSLLDDMLSSYKDKLKTNSSLEKRELVIQILDGSRSEVEQTSRRLGYSLDSEHYAAIVWGEEGDTELSDLEEAAGFFVKMCEQSRELTVIISGEVLWLWTPVKGSINEYTLKTFLSKLPGIKLTYAKGGKGVDGFRRAHMNALSAQRVIGRLRSSASVVSYDQLRLAEIMSRDPEATNSFISSVLGELNTASPDLRQSLLVYIQCGCNVTNTAQILHTHRNTLVRRLGKAEELLPQALSANLVQIAAALEMKRWLS